MAAAATETGEGEGVVILFWALAETHYRNMAYFATFQIQASDSLCEKLQTVLQLKHNHSTL